MSPNFTLVISSDLLYYDHLIKIHIREQQKLHERHSMDVLYFTAEI